MLLALYFSFNVRFNKLQQNVIIISNHQCRKLFQIPSLRKDHALCFRARFQLKLRLRWLPILQK